MVMLPNPLFWRLNFYTTLYILGFTLFRLPFLQTLKPRAAIPRRRLVGYPPFTGGWGPLPSKIQTFLLWYVILGPPPLIWADRDL